MVADDNGDSFMNDHLITDDNNLDTGLEQSADGVSGLHAPTFDMLFSETAPELDSTRHYFGTPMEDMAYWEQQTTPFTCAVEAQRGILESCTGLSFSEAELAAEAAEQGWLHTSFAEDGAGMESVDVGQLLELHGISTHQTNHASMGDLVSELAAGHKVIVGVNSSDLWDSNPLNDFFQQGADHAIWVTGVDTSDPNDIKVIINDSGDPEGAGKSYPLDQFMDAWENSDHFYLATNHAPPDLHLSSPQFDQDNSVFTDIVDWAYDHAMPIGVGLAAIAASGLSASDLTNKSRLCESSKLLREKIQNRIDRRSDDDDLLPE